jgi:PKD repeat protein
LSCNFTDTSTDSDGSVVSWSWAFGDSATSLQQNPSHTYAAGGTYTVTLTVTDDDGASAVSPPQSVTVTAPPGAISLAVRPYKLKSVKYADLTWLGATSAEMDVYRTGVRIVTTPNDGAYTDKPPKTVSSAAYKVCEAGTTTCSNEVTATW